MANFWDPFKEALDSITNLGNAAVSGIDWSSLQEQARAFYETQGGHLEPLKYLSPINFGDPLATSPVKVVKQLSTAKKLFKATTGMGVHHKVKELKKQGTDFYNYPKKGAPTTDVDSILDASNFDTNAPGDNQQSIEGSDNSKGNLKELNSLSDKHNKSTEGGYLSNSSKYIDMLIKSLEKGAGGGVSYKDASNGNTGILIYTTPTTIHSASEPYLELPYIPNEVKVGGNSTFAKINILNRNNVPYQYINGSQEITFTIEWYNTGSRLGDAYLKAKKLSLLASMDGNKFPHEIAIIWGMYSPLFSGDRFYVKSAPYKMTHFNRAKPTSENGLGHSSYNNGYVLPTRISQEVTLVRVQGPRYFTHYDEINKDISNINPSFR